MARLVSTVPGGKWPVQHGVRRAIAQKLQLRRLHCVRHHHQRRQRLPGNPGRHCGSSGASSQNMTSTASGRRGGSGHTRRTPLRVRNSSRASMSPLVVRGTATTISREEISARGSRAILALARGRRGADVVALSWTHRRGARVAAPNQEWVRPNWRCRLLHDFKLAAVGRRGRHETTNWYGWWQRLWICGLVAHRNRNQVRSA